MPGVGGSVGWMSGLSERISDWLKLYSLEPGRSRVAFAVTLPLMMIATTVHIQKMSSDASMRPSGGDGDTVEEIHEANYALLNRTCAGGLLGWVAGDE